MTAMRQAVKNLIMLPDVVLVDGNRAPDLDTRCQTIKKGDALSLSIAAASIVAKVTRDRLMQDYDHQFPGFGFARHKGYGTVQHLHALRQLGPCEIHRASFAPIRKLLSRTD